MACLVLQHKVLGFDISVDYPLFLQVLNNSETLSTEVLDQLSIQAEVVLEESEQVGALDELHLEDQVLHFDLLTGLMMEAEGVL